MFFFIRISWSLFRCWCCTKLEWCICIQCIEGGAYWSEGVWGWKKEAGYKRSGRNTREQSAYNDGKVNLEEKTFYECISWKRDAMALVSLDIWNGKIESNQLFLLWEEGEHCKWEQWFLLVGVSRCLVTLKYGKGASGSLNTARERRSAPPQWVAHSSSYFKGSLPSAGRLMWYSLESLVLF